MTKRDALKPPVLNPNATPTSLAVGVINERSGKRDKVRIAPGAYIVLTAGPCHVFKVAEDKETGEVLIVLKGYFPQPIPPEPHRYMLDGTPCWCVAAKTMRPHLGWVHAKACLDIRATVIPPKMPEGTA